MPAWINKERKRLRDPWQMVAIALATVVAIPLVIVDLASGGAVGDAASVLTDLFFGGWIVGNAVSGASYAGRSVGYVRERHKHRRDKSKRHRASTEAELELEALPRKRRKKRRHHSRHSSVASTEAAVPLTPVAIEPIELVGTASSDASIETEEVSTYTKKKIEIWLTLLGVVLGISLFIVAIAALGVVVAPGVGVALLAGALAFLPAVLALSLCAFMFLGMTSGYFARIGRTIDIVRGEKGVKGLNENHWLAIIGAVIAGLALTIFLIASGAFVGLPVIMAIFAVVAINSTLVSGASYFGRALDFITAGHTVFDYFNWCQKTTGNPLLATGLFILSLGGLLALPFFIKKRLSDTAAAGRPTNENIATTIGVAVALAFGIALLVVGAVATLPFFFGLLPVGIAVIFAVAITVSICGGVATRVGRFLDHRYKEGDEKIVAKEVVKGTHARLQQCFGTRSPRPEARPAPAPLYYPAPTSAFRPRRGSASSATSAASNTRTASPLAARR